MDQRSQPAFPPSHLIPIIIQSILLVRPQTTKRAEIATAISHTTLIDSHDDTIVCDISMQGDKTRPCRAKTAHKRVLGKTYVSLAQKLLRFSDSPHLNTKASIQKLDEVAKAVDFDVSTILVEQFKDPVLGAVCSWIRTNAPPISSHQKSNSLKVS